MRDTKKDRIALELMRVNREAKRIEKKAKKVGNSILIYSFLVEKCLPVLRKAVPKRVYKYFQLGINGSIDIRNINTVKHNFLWSSTSEGYNDPFEGQFMYLNASDMADNDLPIEAINVWRTTMDVMREHITSICFTENPNNMPMWAHYANNHQGFCVEYEVPKNDHLYPVIYTNHRSKGMALFVNVIYILLGGKTTKKEKASILQYIKFLTAFKNADWEAEREVRAVFFNDKKDILNNGRLLPCSLIGITPKRIYAGVNCSEVNLNELQLAAKELGIECIKCSMVQNEGFNVLEESAYA